MEYPKVVYTHGLLGGLLLSSHHLVPAGPRCGLAVLPGPDPEAETSRTAPSFDSRGTEEFETGGDGR